MFEFNVSLSELLPDEDAIGSGVCEFLNNEGNDFYGKYLKSINKELLLNVKSGNFDVFAQIGKIIEPHLALDDKKTIVNGSATATIDKPIFPIKSYIVKKPNTRFFKTKDEYINWFNENNSKY